MEFACLRLYTVYIQVHRTGYETVSKRLDFTLLDIYVCAVHYALIE